MRLLRTFFEIWRDIALPVSLAWSSSRTDASRIGFGSASSHEGDGAGRV